MRIDSRGDIEGFGGLVLAIIGGNRDRRNSCEGSSRRVLMAVNREKVLRLSYSLVKLQSCKVFGVILIDAITSDH
jgi:hypothetical protein